MDALAELRRGVLNLADSVLKKLEQKKLNALLKKELRRNG